MKKEFRANAKQDVSLNMLQYWLYRRSKKSGSTTNFLPVMVVSSPAPKVPVGEVVEFAAQGVRGEVRRP